MVGDEIIMLSEVNVCSSVTVGGEEEEEKRMIEGE
jgi:hypothetical protein